MIKKINNNDREFATSNCLAVYEFFQDGAPIFCHENLYRTTSGSYFLKVETGPDSFQLGSVGSCRSCLLIVRSRS